MRVRLTKTPQPATASNSTSGSTGRGSNLFAAASQRLSSHHHHQQQQQQNGVAASAVDERKPAAAIGVAAGGGGGGGSSVSMNGTGSSSSSMNGASTTTSGGGGGSRTSPVTTSVSSVASGTYNEHEDSTSNNDHSHTGGCDDDTDYLTDGNGEIIAVDDENGILSRDRNGSETSDDGHEGQHPHMRHVCVINCQNQTRIVPNGPPAVLSNDCFEGRVMLLIRTPDVDDRSFESVMSATPLEISRYFKDKKRRFEFQFQIKLKKVPEGPLFLGCELEHPIKVGAITKGLVGILMAMCRRINPGFHYSWGTQDSCTEQERATGNYEKTHLSFPVEASMDRVVVTKPGEALPALGEELHESNESVKRRRRLGAGSIDWNLDDTYTMCLWSAYADWIKWRSLNVPGVSPFSLSRVTGTQPIYLSVYEISGICPQEYKRRRGVPHSRKDLNVYTRLEFSNVHATRGGYAERLFGIKARNVSGVNGNLMMASVSEMSLPDTESVNSDFDTASRTSKASRITMF